MALSINQVGEKLDLTVRQGSTLGPFRHMLTDADGVPINLTGYKVRGSVRKTAASTEVIADFEITMAADPTEGYYDFVIQDEVTAEMEVGVTTTSPESVYVWDSELETPDGRVIPLYFGVLRLQAEVTREG